MTAIFINEIKFHKCVYLEGNIKRKLPLYTEEKKQFLCMWKAVKIHLFVSTFTFVKYFIVLYLIVYVKSCYLLPFCFQIYSLLYILLYGTLLCMWKAVKCYLFVSTFTFRYIFYCSVPHFVCKKLWNTHPKRSHFQTDLILP